VKLRALFNLRSAAVTIHISSSNVVLTTKGFGHGVGMSQYGANAYARGGMSYSDILLHYYSTGSAASAGPQVKILAYTLTEQDPDLAG
jgi:stage II sporulation protein D